jgi:DNA polymerase-3 subunit epsilon
MDETPLLVGLVFAFAVLMVYLFGQQSRAPDQVADAINRRMENSPSRVEPTLPKEPPPPLPPSPPACDEPKVEPAPSKPPLFSPEIVAKMPARVLFLDVETTGLHSDDRIVSLGALTLETERLVGDNFSVMPLHLVFDPMKKSHREAERVHGWDDWILRHQDLFQDHAAEIRAVIDAADLLVAHNASFDVRFIDRELTLAGLTMPGTPVECTMRAWRAKGLSRATLNAVCSHLGLARAGDVHGALEDAGLAMQAWLALHGPGMRLGPIAYPPPTNLKPAPPRPDGALPRRKSRKAPPPV